MKKKVASESIRLHEIFWSAQGEGLHSGKSAIFIRLSGCSIRCDFCDQKDAWQDGELFELDGVLAKIEALRKRYPASLVVITGGEPLEQDISSLIEELRKREFYTAIETSGCLFQDLATDWWTVAPKAKRNYKIHPSLTSCVNEVKLVVTPQLNIKTIKSIRRKIPPIPIFLQPQFFDSKKYQRTYQLFEECQQQAVPDIRLGLQLHTVYKIQ